MNSQLNTSKSFVFVGFCLSLAAVSAAFILNLIQGYSPFNPTQLPLSKVSAPYFTLKYVTGVQRIFLTITTSLFITEFFTLIGFLLSLCNVKNKSCTKNQWLSKNMPSLLYLSAALCTISLTIGCGWQTSILIQLLLSNTSASAINLASVAFCYLALLCFLLDLVLIARFRTMLEEQEIKPRQKNQKECQRTLSQNNYEFKISQRPKSKEYQPLQSKMTKKHIKSTKKKQDPLSSQCKKTQQPQILEDLLEELKANSIYQAKLNCLKDQIQIIFSSGDIGEQQRSIDHTVSPIKTQVPRLALNKIAPKNNEVPAKVSLSKLDISAILPSQPHKLELEVPYEDKHSDNATILGRIKQGKIPVEGLKSPRPDIKKIRETLKTQHNVPTPKNYIPTLKNSGQTPKHTNSGPLYDIIPDRP